ncbi:PBSX family phage terminase large subunit [Salipaludibacillus sp. CF4.18]|uniref:PBSX family phage terminase large subunit n=1 Tax=Salipaludibacillus sp. CF4.18 TaxID=3373081 RepID=UPI003EE46063
MKNNLDSIYTEKQQTIYKRCVNDDWFMLINHGAKRSGKTVLNNDLFLQELIRVRKITNKLGIEKPMYIVSGATLGTIQNNILTEISNKYGIEFKFDKHNNFYLFGVYCVQAGHSSIAHLDKIRGMTAFGAYINEGSLANEIVFDEIKSRCSGEGARILTDTNPDHPEHYLKRDYIDNPDPSIISYQFRLDDNTFLSERYRKNIRGTTPSGMFTERNIDGQWVSADGAVYKDFDQRIHYVDHEEIKAINFKTYFAGVDWGYEHFGSVVVLGVSDKGLVYVIEEHAKQHEEIDYWVKVAKGVKERYGNINFYCDTARPEHIKRFRREKLRAINADKSVLSGIEAVSSFFKTGRLNVVKDKVDRFRQEIYMYVWNKKSGEPVKEWDDVLDALRYAIYTHYKKEFLRGKR